MHLIANLELRIIIQLDRGASPEHVKGADKMSVYKKIMNPVPCAYPCESCGEDVPTDEYCGNDKPDGTTEYLCSDCFCDHATTCDEDEMNGCPSCGSHDIGCNSGFAGEEVVWCNSCGFMETESHDEVVALIQ